jgi:hypothetical protein
LDPKGVDVRLARPGYLGTGAYFAESILYVS